MYHADQGCFPHVLSAVVKALRSTVGDAWVKEEAIVGGGVISIDALITPPTNGSGSIGRVAVEVDGPVHFFTNRAREPTGTTLFKGRLLDLAVQRGELSGWVCVPYWEWGACKGESERRAYMRELLEAKGLSVEGEA
jgi:hypothetical protein